MEKEFAEFCAAYLQIRDKASRRLVPFVLNKPQRKIINIMETDRKAGKPGRYIILKARQWGCSTVIAAYMLWLGLILGNGIHTAICAQTRDTSLTIRSMAEDFAMSLPERFSEDGQSKLKAKGCLSLKKVDS